MNMVGDLGASKEGRCLYEGLVYKEWLWLWMIVMASTYTKKR